MPKPKRKLTAEQKRARKKLHGKQKRVKRPPTIEGMDVDEFIRQNADPLWFHQNEMWEYIIESEETDSQYDENSGSSEHADLIE